MLAEPANTARQNFAPASASVGDVRSFPKLLPIGQLK
jgi:hypothetical protein